jgi:hypothetical protein
MVVSLAMSGFQPQLASRHLRALHEIGGACQVNTPADLDEGKPNRRRQMAPPSPGPRSGSR